MPTARPETISMSGIDVEIVRAGGGKGRTLLYLHAPDGIGSCLMDAPHITALSAHFDVVAPSHPGFGTTGLPRHFRDVDDLAYFYLDLIEHLRLKDLIVVGSSFGGWIASEIAIRCQERISALVLAAPMGLSIWNDPSKRILDLISVPIAELPATLFHDQARGMAAFGNLDFAAMDEDAVIRFVRNRESLTLFGWSPVLSSARLPDWLHRIKVPTHLVWGRNDAVVPPALAGEYRKRIPGCTAELIDQAGHYLHLEQPEKFAEAVVAFAHRAVRQADKV